MPFEVLNEFDSGGPPSLLTKKKGTNMPEAVTTSQVKEKKEFEDFVKTLPKGKLALTEKEYKLKQIAAEKKKSNRLIRCRIICMNPEKKHMPGEMISVGSSKLGTFMKYIPYASDEPYHIPYILYQHLKEKECPVKYTRRLANGQEVNKYKMIKEYNIEVLDPLTKDEFQEIATRQAMASGGDDR